MRAFSLSFPTGSTFRLCLLMMLIGLLPAIGAAQHHGDPTPDQPCDTTPIKLPFHDTTLYVGDECKLINPSQASIVWRLPCFYEENDVYEGDNTESMANTISVSHVARTPSDLPCLDEGSFYFAMRIDANDIPRLNVCISLPRTAPFSYSVQNNNPNCPDREGDTVYIHFRSQACDSTPIKMPFHDTAFCEGDSLLLVATEAGLPNHRVIWRNLSSVAEVIYEGNTLWVREPGLYTYDVISVVTDCVDREGDTVNVTYWPKPQPFLPIDTLTACGGSDGALTFTLNQPGIHILWSDGSIDTTARFAYRGDTLDTFVCRLDNICGDTVYDSVTIRFLPPYVYLGGDSLVGCRDDSVRIDVSRYNRHLPHYDELRFTWTLRGDTVLDGRPGEAGALWVRFPQDTGLLTVHVQWEAADGTDPDSPDPAAGCPVAADTVDLRLYLWPDIDFFVRNGDTTICHYDSIGLFLDRDSLVFSPDAYYIWLFDSVPFDTTADKIIYAADSGLYTVTGVNYCSRHSESFFLHHHPAARITVELKDTSVCPDIPVSIDPTLPYGGNRYVWFSGGAGEDGDDDGTGDDDSGNYLEFRNPDEEPEDPDEWPWDASAALWVDTPGVYTLYVMDSAGCWSKNEINITEEDCTPQFEAPNVFTPNGDGVNDLFKLKTMEQLFDFEIKIFNRWGNQVHAFKGEPEEFSWDGNLKSNGQPAADGVYFYIATYKDYKGKKKKQSGSVTILR